MRRSAGHRRSDCWDATAARRVSGRVGVGTVLESLLLHSAAHLVNGLHPEPGDVEGVQHLRGRRQVGTQRGQVPPERVQGAAPSTAPNSGCTAGPRQSRWVMPSTGEWAGAVAGVVSVGGGDVGDAGEAQDADGGVSLGGHDLWSGAGADLGSVFVVGDVAYMCAVRRCCFEWR